jgi:hypothetical protein
MLVEAKATLENGKMVAMAHGKTQRRFALCRRDSFRGGFSLLFHVHFVWLRELDLRVFQHRMFQLVLLVDGVPKEIDSPPQQCLCCFHRRFVC